MNYKTIVFFILSSLCYKSFAIDSTFNTEFMKLCDIKSLTEQRQASITLKTMLNQSNYLNIIKWINSKECNGTYPITYAIAADNLFIVQELIDYLSYDPNKQRPFSYLNDPITESSNIAKKCYDSLLVREQILKQCALGNKPAVVLLCNFFANCLNHELLTDAIFQAIASEQEDIIKTLNKYLVNTM